MSDKRTKRRVGLTSFQQVRDADGGRVLGYVADITTDGLRVAGKEAFEVGKRLRLRLRYVLIGGEIEDPVVDVECIWTGEVEGALSAETGFCFLHMDDGVRASLDRILEDLARRE